VTETQLLVRVLIVVIALEMTDIMEYVCIKFCSSLKREPKKLMKCLYMHL